MRRGAQIPPQLFPRIFWPPKRPPWQRSRRARDPRNIRIANQRQYRMIKRRSAQLDLPAFRRFAISRQNHPNQLYNFFLQRRFIALREIPPLRRQPANHFIFFQPRLFDPSQLRQNLQIPPVIRRKRHQRLRPIRRPRPFIQLHKSFPPRHQPLMIYLKRPRQNLRLVFPRQRLRILKRQRKPRLIKILASIFFQLHPQRRHHIERRMKSRKFLQHFHHPKIIFRSMQPRPRQHIPPALRIPILRLVHMPQHHQIHSIHRPKTSSPTPLSLSVRRSFPGCPTRRIPVWGFW